MFLLFVTLNSSQISGRLLPWYVPSKAHQGSNVVFGVSLGFSVITLPTLEWVPLEVAHCTEAQFHTLAHLGGHQC